MKAIIYSKYGSAQVLKHQDVPDPEPKEGEVLVEIIASSVNPTDIKIRNGSLKALAGKKKADPVNLNLRKSQSRKLRASRSELPKGRHIRLA